MEDFPETFAKVVVSSNIDESRAKANSVSPLPVYECTDHVYAVQIIHDLFYAIEIYIASIQSLPSLRCVIG